MRESSGSSIEFELAIFERDDNLLFIKTGVVLYASCSCYLLIFVCLFLIFAFVRGQREARGDHVRTLHFEAKKRSADKKIRRQKGFLIRIIKKHPLVCRHVYLMRLCDMLFALSFRNDLSCLVPLNKLRVDSFFSR